MECASGQTVPQLLVWVRIAWAVCARDLAALIMVAWALTVGMARMVAAEAVVAAVAIVSGSTASVLAVVDRIAWAVSVLESIALNARVPVRIAMLAAVPGLRARHMVGYVVVDHRR